MFSLPNLSDFDFLGKKIIVRADLDVGDELLESDIDKLLTQKGTVDYLVEHGGKLILIGHRGRPGGERVEELSLKEVAVKLSEVVGKEVKFIDGLLDGDSRGYINQLGNGEVLMLQNLRFDSREEKNDEEFARQLAELGEVYVNDAFSVSHREHTSIVGIPRFLPHAAGDHLVSEVENLGKVLENPKRPVVVIISGVKKDKLDRLEEFKKISDKVLIGGRLPLFMDEDVKDDRLLIARLVQDKEDITMHSIEQFEKEITKAGTIVVSGPVGKFEDEGHRQGTQRVFEAAANSSAYKVAGGGDTEQALKLLGLKEKFDWISVGGGASLEFLAKGSLPGIEALMS